MGRVLATYKCFRASIIYYGLRIVSAPLRHRRCLAVDTAAASAGRLPRVERYRDGESFRRGWRCRSIRVSGAGLCNEAAPTPPTYYFGAAAVVPGHGAVELVGADKFGADDRGSVSIQMNVQHSFGRSSDQRSATRWSENDLIDPALAGSKISH